VSRLLLALETATRWPSVALLRGAELAGEIALPPSRAVSEELLPAIDALLVQSAVALAAVDALAVSIGPGSFTGLRVGLATVKGLAFGEPLLVAPVSTLAALACGAGDTPEPVAALLDARRDEVYAGVYAPGGAGSAPLVAEGLYGLRELAAVLPARCVLVGEGALLHAAAWPTLTGPGVRVLGEEARAPRARDVARLGRALLEAGGGVAADALVPRYLRRAEAEVRRTGERVEL
jgi:tRNA threonylcarbamoyladenosine biosynthesis protein TsaB